MTDVSTMINSDDLFYISSYKQDVISDNILGEYLDLGINEFRNHEIKDEMLQLKKDMFIGCDIEMGDQMIYVDQLNNLNASLIPQTAGKTAGKNIQIDKPITSKDFIHCSHCKTKNTSLWRRQDGLVMCNACALYKRLHGIPRPLYLNSGEIKKRNRSSSTKRFK